MQSVRNHPPKGPAKAVAHPHSPAHCDASHAPTPPQHPTGNRSATATRNRQTEATILRKIRRCRRHAPPSRLRTTPNSLAESAHPPTPMRAPTWQPHSAAAIPEPPQASPPTPHPHSVKHDARFRPMPDAGSSEQHKPSLHAMPHTPSKSPMREETKRLLMFFLPLSCRKNTIRMKEQANPHPHRRRLALEPPATGSPSFPFASFGL